MREKGVLWSDRADLDGLLGYMGLKCLPEIVGEGRKMETDKTTAGSLTLLNVKIMPR